MSVRRLLLYAILVLAAVALGLPPALEALGLGPDRSRIPAPGEQQPVGAGRSLNVYDHGSGTPVVLVHGLPSSAADWADTPAQLVRRGLRAIVYDRIGYGDSSRGNPDDPDDYTYASNARDLGALLDGRGVDRAVLVGWSYGGGVVQTFAAEHPERVSGLVLVGSVGPALAEREEPPLGFAVTLAGSAPGQALLRWAARVPPLARLMTDGPLTIAFSGASEIPPGWHDYTAAMLARPGTFEAWMAEGDPQRLDQIARVDPGRLAMPALVVHGTDDRLVDYAVAEDLARRLPRARLVPIFEGSHMLPVTHAARLAEEIARFAAP